MYVATYFASAFKQYVHLNIHTTYSDMKQIIAQDINGQTMVDITKVFHMI